MPDFDYDGYVNIDIDDFLNACSKRDIDEIIDSLIENGHLKDSDRVTDKRMQISAPEQIFEEAINKLHGKWNRLSKEEEIILMTIANKF